MEVMISAAVLILVVLGVFAALDASTSTAGANKARTVAATLAEKDQERMRAMRTTDIDAMNTAPYDVTVANVPYHVESEAEWIYDASGAEVSCGLATGQASYMRITTTVTSRRVGTAVKPVVIQSIVAPQVGAAAAGSLSVAVKGAAGQPIKDVTVTAPPASTVETTNELGCAVFGSLIAGTYTVTLAKPGFVDKEGAPNPSKPITVTAGSMSTAEFAYDQAAEVNVRVKSIPGGADEPSAGVVAVNGALGAGIRTFALTSAFTPMPTIPYPNDSVNVTGPPAVTINTFSSRSFALTGLFPFTDGYTMFSGRCLPNDPSKAPGNGTYFDSHSGRVVLAPGASGGTLDVYEPPQNIRITRSGSGRNGADVWAYPTAATCGGVRIPLGQTQTVGATSGKLPYPGLPFGEYKICAELNISGTWYEALLDSPTLKVTDPNGGSLQTIDLDDSNERCGVQAP
jgi:Tfp pilus assembly protein PilV